MQSLDGLTQDPNDGTNELLQNLTELDIAVSGVNASHLSIPSPVPFEPEGDVVRLNFYWSLSLVLSVRCYYLLDSIVSSSLPLSGPFAPIFIAGLLSTIFAVSVATYTVWTVFHGWFYPDLSPFQSTISQLWVLHGPSITHRAKHISRSLLHYYRFWKTRFAAIRASSSIQTPSFDAFCAEPSDIRQLDVSSENTAPLDATLEPHDIEAFHATLQVTHDVDVVDQAVAAYPSLISYCAFRFKAKSAERDWRVFQRPGITPTAYEIESLAYMLSDEANIRINIIVAAFIADPFVSDTLSSEYIHHRQFHA